MTKNRSNEKFTRDIIIFTLEYHNEIQYYEFLKDLKYGNSNGLGLHSSKLKASGTKVIFVVLKVMISGYSPDFRCIRMKSRLCVQSVYCQYELSNMYSVYIPTIWVTVELLKASDAIVQYIFKPSTQFRVERESRAKIQIFFAFHFRMEKIGN